jgi:uroporphyrinogen-III synthase
MLKTALGFMSRSTFFPADAAIRRIQSRLFLASKNPIISIALTREEGKNEKLRQAIHSSNLQNKVTTIELPCIDHAHGADYNILAQTLYSSSTRWDYVIVTSPEAARVLASVWDVKHDNNPAVAAVGKATEAELNAFGIQVAFTPSIATAKVLVKELDGEESMSILYPASTKAADTLADGLTARGMKVTRLNTYDTVTAQWKDDQKLVADSCQIACFASPSSVKGWLTNTDNNNKVLAACIGETSAQACRNLGWKEEAIFYPEAPGIEGWVEAVEQALQSAGVIQ